MSALSSPSAIQSVSLSGSPLSKTDCDEPDDVANTTGSHWRPSAAGSLHTRSGLVGEPFADPGAAALSD